MATLNTQTVTRAGLNPTYAAAAAGGDKIKPGPRTFLHVKNGGGISVDVTLATPGDVEGQAIADLVVAVPASGERMIGPVDDLLFRSTVDGLCAVTYSATTSVTVAAIQV